jgi:hypothetical protein
VKKLRPKLKSHLRACGQVALEQRGFRVEIKPGAGIVTGARLRAFKEADEYEVAVRTSLDREVGLTRGADGRWLTIPRMDQVIVVVPSAEDPACAEVLCFKPKVLIAVFDRALAIHKEHNPAFSHKAPIFVALDEAGDGNRAQATTGLKARAEWTHLVPLASVPPHGTVAGGFIERVKREFAALNGVDVSKVSVEFRIIA